MNHQHLLKLSADLDRVINFDLAGIGKALWRGTTGRAALKWGGIGAAGGAVAGGASAAMSDDPNASVLGGALGGAAAGGALGALGGGGMRAYKTYGRGTTRSTSLGLGRSAAPAVPAAPAAGATTNGASLYPNTSVADALAAKRAAVAPTGLPKPPEAFRKKVLGYSSRLDRLIQLSAKADQLISFAYDDEDESHILRNTGAVGALGIGGAYLRGKRIPVNAAGGLLSAAEAQPGVMGALRRAGGTIAQGGRALAGDMGLTGIKDTFMKGYGKGGVMRGIRGAARSITKGKSRFVGLSSRLQSLVQLSEELDGVVELARGDQYRKLMNSGSEISKLFGGKMPVPRRGLGLEKGYVNLIKAKRKEALTAA